MNMPYPGLNAAAKTAIIRKTIDKVYVIYCVRRIAFDEVERKPNFVA